MKIMHVINNLDGGGAERIVIDLAIIQQQEKHHVIVVLLNTGHNILLNNLMTSDLIIRDIEVINMRCKKYSLYNILKLRKIFKKIKPEVIHSHLFPSQYYVIFASVNLNIRLITTEHSTDNKRRHKIYLKPLESYIYSKYDKIVAVGDSVYHVCLKYLPKIAKNIVKINNGINLKRFQAMDLSKNYLGLADDIFIITMVARMSRAKDHQTLIKAMGYLSPNIHLVLAGSGELEPILRKLVENIAITNRVHFLGFRQDITQVLSVSDVVVLSSNWEGFGLAVVEAMAIGKPVIVSDINGVRDIVSGYGELFNIGDAKELAQKINNLYTDHGHYLSVASSCKKRSLDFDIKETNRAYLDLYTSKTSR